MNFSLVTFFVSERRQEGDAAFFIPALAVNGFSSYQFPVFIISAAV